jgi:predicted nucleic acid-binding protein
MVYLLDTSALLSHYRKEFGADKVQLIFEDDSNDIFISAISIPEFGRRLKDLGADDSEIESAIAEYLLIIPAVIPADKEIAHEAFHIWNNTPGRLPLVDSIIAATAKNKSACLVHRDKHMGLIPKKILNQMSLD